MYLEDRIRTIEDRINSLEQGSRSDNEIRERVAELEDKGNRLAKRTHTIENRLDEMQTAPSGNSNLDERVDQCETTCHDLLSADDDFKQRCDSFDRKLTSLSKQLEDMFEQIAELDSRDGKVDTSPLENRLKQMEGSWQDLNSLRGLRKELQDRLDEMERSAAKGRSRIDSLDEMIEGLRGRVNGVESATEPLRSLPGKFDSLAQDSKRKVEELGGKIDKNARDTETRLMNIERETLPTRVRQIEDKISTQDGTQRVTGLASRLDLIERDSQETRKEVAWLRDRPMGMRFDQFARSLGGLALVAGIVAIVLYLWPITTLTAQRFVLVDRNKHQLGEWTSRDVGAYFELKDQESRRRLYLTATETGAQLTLADQHGTERTKLVSEPGAGAGLSLTDATGQPRLWCGVEGNPMLSMYDAEGEKRGTITVEANGPSIALLEKGQRPSVKLVTGRADNGLRVYDDVGRLRVGAGMSADGAAVNLFDSKEQRRVVLSSNASSSALAFLGKDEIQRTTLGMTVKDESILNLHDNAGRQRILLIASESDAKMEVLDRETNVVFQSPGPTPSP